MFGFCDIFHKPLLTTIRIFHSLAVVVVTCATNCLTFCEFLRRKVEDENNREERLKFVELKKIKSDGDCRRSYTKFGRKFCLFRNPDFSRTFWKHLAEWMECILQIRFIHEQLKTFIEFTCIYSTSKRTNSTFSALLRRFALTVDTLFRSWMNFHFVEYFSLCGSRSTCFGIEKSLTQSCGDFLKTWIFFHNSSYFGQCFVENIKISCNLLAILLHGCF